MYRTEIFCTGLCTIKIQQSNPLKLCPCYNLLQLIFWILKTDFILEVTSTRIATVQRILNYSAFNEYVYNWFIIME